VNWVTELGMRTVGQGRARGAIGDDFLTDSRVEDAERVRAKREEEQTEARIGHEEDFFVKSLHGD
jgi:hypothetical protein